jgi:hypothetical protein
MSAPIDDFRLYAELFTNETMGNATTQLERWLRTQRT